MNKYENKVSNSENSIRINNCINNNNNNNNKKIIMIIINTKQKKSLTYFFQVVTKHEILRFSKKNRHSKFVCLYLYLYFFHFFHVCR